MMRNITNQKSMRNQWACSRAPRFQKSFVQADSAAAQRKTMFHAAHLSAPAMESAQKEHRKAQAGPAAIRKKAKAVKKAGGPTDSERKKNPKVTLLDLTSASV